MAFSLQARVVFPVDRPPIENGVVTIDGERIVAVGTAADGDEFDLGSVALLPGLVNAHTHLEFSDLRRPLGEPGMRLADWIRLVIEQRARGGTFVSGSILRGLVESWRCGVTTIGEIMQRFAVTPLDSGAEAGELVLFLEVIGFSRSRAESAYIAAVERLDTLAERVDASVGISPHAPYTVSPDLLRRLVGLARDRGLRVAMHLAESADELELLQSGSGPFRDLLEERGMWDAGAIPRGSRPLDYLRELAEAPRAVVIHGNYLNEEERSFLAANADRMSLIYCPRTHAYFQYPPYPLGELLAAGVRVALGTDSRASNPDLDLLAEMRFVARTHPTIDPHDILRMGTLSGAEALGLDAEVGSLTPGKLANIVAVPLPDVAPATADESCSAILAGRDLPCAVWDRGCKIGDAGGLAEQLRPPTTWLSGSAGGGLAGR